MTDPRHTEEARRANLEKLAAYLEALPEDYDHFYMATFIEDNEDYEALNHYAKHNGGVHTCGTAACAVGHGPAAGIFFDDDEFDEDVIWDAARDEYIDSIVPDWSKYSGRFAAGGTDCRNDFGFLFGGEWSLWDNTHTGAAKRIRYYLANGLPKEFVGRHGYLETKAAVEKFFEK